MIIVGDKLVSEELLEEAFLCDLSRCKGACCVEGDSGAPLKDEEASLLEDQLEYIKPYLASDGLEVLNKVGAFEIDTDGDIVTPLVGGAHCAFTVFDDFGIAHCGIERAWKAGNTAFRKPISCHLYPIRTIRLKDYEALNYDRWDICKPGCEAGKSIQLPVYRFLREALIRAYGEGWYDLLEETADAWKKMKESGNASEAN
jgi:hypothetical protein